MKKPPEKKLKFNQIFDQVAGKITDAVGKPVASIAALALILCWGLSGPLFKFSDTWQLVINTTTTIVTFIMVFIIQLTQNKDTKAIQLKLNELIACNEHASNRLVDIEDLTEDELNLLKDFYIKLSQLSKSHNNLYASHSVDEAQIIHAKKNKDSTKRKP